MARMRCAKCSYMWVRRVRFSRGQLIRCPSCRAVLGKLSVPISPFHVNEYREGKAIDEYDI